MADSPKPKVLVARGDTWPLAPDIMQAVKESPAVFSRSSDRLLRAIRLYTGYGARRAGTRGPANPAPFPGMPKLGKGTQPEWVSKKILSAAGIRVPDGALARAPDDAVAIATRVGYPVALKAQAATLAHKSEAGGVMLNLAAEAALRAAWGRIQRNVERSPPRLTRDGCLVATMSPKGLALMIGAKRDPAWGTLLLAALV